MDEIIKFTNKELDIKSDLIAISTLRPWINAGRVGSIALNKLKNTTNAKLVGSLKNPKIYGAGLLSSVGESQNCLTVKGLFLL